MNKTIIIHQATYGEINKGHDLIQTSFSDRQLAKSIKSNTDLFPKAPMNLGKLQSYISGFSTNTHFIILKTFLDKSASRSSMVFTHSLWIPNADIKYINDFSTILELQPPTIDKEYKLTPVTLTSTSPIEQPHFEGYQRKIIANLLNNQSSIWLDTSTFENILCNLWNGLPDFARKELRFRLSFSPEDIDFLQPNLIYTPVTTKNKWEGYSVIESHNKYESNSLSEYYLLRETTKAQALFDLQEALQYAPTTFGELGQLEQIYSLLQRNEKGFNPTLRLVRLIGNYAPSQESSIKQKWINELNQHIINSSIADFSKLRNLDISTFSAYKETFIGACQQWLRKSIFKIEATLIPRFVNDCKAWFKREVIHIIQSKINHWQSTYAQPLWSWITIANDLINLIEIPNQQIIEKDLVKQYPNDFSKNLAQSLFKISIQHHWVELHAIAIPKLYSPQKSIERQLIFDNSTDTVSLKLLAQQLPPKSIIEYTLGKPTKRLITVSGGLCAKNTHLFQDFDVQNKTWLSIWIASFPYISDIWKGIAQPQHVLFILLDKLLANQIDVQKEYLFEQISLSNQNNLFAYPNRKQIWSVLPSKSKKRFLIVTTRAWLNDLERHEYVQVEREIQSTISTIIREIVTSSYSIRLILKLFEKNTQLTERELLFLLDTRYKDISDVLLAKRLGKLINGREWKKAFDKIKILRIRNRMLDYAVEECNALRRKHLLSILGWFYDTPSTATQATKEHIRRGIFDFLRNNNPEEALQRASEWNEVDRMPYQSKIITWQSQLNRLNDEKRLKTISQDDYHSKRNDLIWAILEDMREW